MSTPTIEQINATGDTIPFRFRELIGTGFQGVADPSRAFPRDELVRSVLNQVKDNRFVILQSPPACGKTTLLQLTQNKCKFEKNVKYLRFSKSENPYETLSFIGINVKTGDIHPDLLIRDVIIMLDDAQNAFSYDLNQTFWNDLSKRAGPFFPVNIRFLIASTSTYLIGGEDSPAEFSNFPKFSPEQILLDLEIFFVRFLRFRYYDHPAF